MSPRQSFRDRMCQLWHGPLTRQQIVRNNARAYTLAFGRVFSERRLKEIWEDAKARGVLPFNARPCFIHSTAPVNDNRGVAVIAGDAIDGVADRALMREIDRSEKLSERADELNAAGADASLAALRAAHPDLDNPESQTSPALWLKRDADVRLAPPHAQLMAMARKFDQGAY